jgi:hypothetical protein
MVMLLARTTPVPVGVAVGVSVSVGVAEMSAGDASSVPMANVSVGVIGSSVGDAVSTGVSVGISAGVSVAISVATTGLATASSCARAGRVSGAGDQMPIAARNANMTTMRTKRDME